MTRERSTPKPNQHRSATPYSDYDDALDPCEQAPIEGTQKQAPERGDACRQSLAQAPASARINPSEPLSAHISTPPARDMIHCSLIIPKNCVCEVKISGRKRLRTSIDEDQNSDSQTRLSLIDPSAKRRRRHIGESQAQTFTGKKLAKSKDDKPHCIIPSDAEKKGPSLLSPQEGLSTDSKSKKPMTEWLYKQFDKISDSAILAAPLLRRRASDSFTVLDDTNDRTEAFKSKNAAGRTLYDNNSDKTDPFSSPSSSPKVALEQPKDDRNIRDKTVPALKVCL